MSKAQSLTAENRRLREANRLLKKKNQEAIALLELLISQQNQTWDKDKLCYQLQEGIKLLSDSTTPPCLAAEDGDC